MKFEGDRPSQTARDRFSKANEVGLSVTPDDFRVQRYLKTSEASGPEDVSMVSSKFLYLSFLRISCGYFL